MQINESVIQGLFPVPVYFTTLNREITKEEFNFVKEENKNVIKNEGNYRSKNSYILEEYAFKELKNYFNLVIHDYFTKIMQAKDIVPYITQSWLNYTQENQFHQTHMHSNSIISGVFYFNADTKNDSITFWRKDNDYQIITPNINTYNIWNSDKWSFNVGTNHLILFPSNLKHSVSLKKDNNIRISLAFNTFVRGNLGDENTLSMLKL